MAVGGLRHTLAAFPPGKSPVTHFTDAGSIPDGVIGIFINIILPAPLWSWG